MKTVIAALLAALLLSATVAHAAPAYDPNDQPSYIATPQGGLYLAEVAAKMGRWDFNSDMDTGDTQMHNFRFYKNGTFVICGTLDGRHFALATNGKTDVIDIDEVADATCRQLGLGLH
jgi:hypothetical protein